MSPSLWIDRGAIFRWAQHRALPAEARVYLDGGGREPATMLAGARRMAELLESRGVHDVRFRDDPRGTHSERSWRRRLLPALRFHFGYARSTRHA